MISWKLNGNTWRSRVAARIEQDREQIAAIAVGLCVFVGSWFFAPMYFDGDQRTYSRAYHIVEGMDLFTAHHFYEHVISSGDYVHFFIVWVASTLAIEKNLIMALSNSMLASFSYMLLRRWGASRPIAAAMVMTNFYWYVMYFSAERLKFAILFLVLSLLSVERVLISILFALAGIFSHYSMLIILGGVALMTTARSLESKKLFEGRVWIIFSVPLVMFIAILLMNNPMLWSKLATYHQISAQTNFLVIAPALLLVALSCFYAKRIIQPALLFLPTIIGVATIGGSRLNMLAFFLFLYFGLRAGGGFNFGVITTSLYLGYKSIGYVTNVVEHGHAFP